MDDRLEKALSHGNYALTVAREKKNIRERFKVAIQYSINGGTFEATSELISFVDLMVRREEDSIVFIDMNGNPIMIEDVGAFQTALLDVYHGATNEYFTAYEKLRKARNVKAVVGL